MHLPAKKNRSLYHYLFVTYKYLKIVIVSDGFGRFRARTASRKKFSVPTLLGHKNRKQTKPKLGASQLVLTRLIDLTAISCHFFNKIKHKTDVSFLAFKTKRLFDGFYFQPVT